MRISAPGSSNSRRRWARSSETHAVRERGGLAGDHAPGRPTPACHPAGATPFQARLRRGYPDNDDAENIDWDLTRFARALAYAEPDAYLWGGATVLELNHIGTYTSRNTCIATPTRRRVKQGVTWKTTVTPASQTVFEALTSSRGMFDDDKYRQALDDAVNRHLIDDTQRETLGYSLKRHPADLPRR